MTDAGTSTGVSTPRTPKQQFADRYAREHDTTLRVLAAFPADRADYTPHERSSTAMQLAWTFFIENDIALRALRGPLTFTGQAPSPPPTFAEAIRAYRSSARELLDLLAAVPESRLDETVDFFTGPKQIEPVKVVDLLWLMLLDSIHHRGQLSVYVRCAGGKVPSIYGPSGDEPWT